MKNSGESIGNNGGKDMWNEPSGPFQSINIRSPKRSEEQVTPDAPTQNRASVFGPNLTNETADSVAAERAKESRARRIARKVIFATGIALTSAAVIFGAKNEKTTDEQATKEDLANSRARVEATVNKLYSDADNIYVADNLISINYGDKNYSFTPDKELNAKSNSVMVDDGKAIAGNESEPAIGKLVGEVEGTMTIQEAMNELREQVEQN